MLSRHFLTKENHQEVESLFELLRECHDQNEVHEHFQEISELWLEHANPNIRKRMHLAMECVIEEEAALGIEILDKVLKEDAAYPEALHLRGTCEFFLGNYKKAIAYYEHCLGEEPRHFGAISGLTSICFLLGDDRKALTWLQKLRAVTPQNEALHEQIALTKEMIMAG